MKKIQKKYRELTAEEMLQVICRLADGQKALELVVLDVRGLASFADYFVLLSGTSTRHVQGLADIIDGEIGSKRLKSGNTEGLNDGNWVLLDYNDIVIHIFHHESRHYYDLEGLWHDAPRIDPLTLPVPREDAKPEKKRAPRQPLSVAEMEAAAARKASVASARKSARAVKIAASKARSAEAKKASIIAKKKVGAQKASGSTKTAGGMRRPAAPTKKKSGTARKKTGAGRK